MCKLGLLFDVMIGSCFFFFSEWELCLNEVMCCCNLWNLRFMKFIRDCKIEIVKFLINVQFGYIYFVFLKGGSKSDLSL